MAELVSVVTLTYKRFEKLFETIDSVLSQDYPNIEYIISDDGSPDFPEQKINEYVASHKRDNITSFSVIRHDENQGTVRNINGAYKAAKGEIIIPVSSDDSFNGTDIVSRIVKVYEERQCEALLIGRALYDVEGRFVKNIPDAKQIKALTRSDDVTYRYRRFITCRVFEAYSGCVLSLRKSFIESWGYFDEKYVLLEDAPFFAKYLCEHKLECAFDITGIRYGDGGVSSKIKHPLLLKDDSLYTLTDRSAHLDRLTWSQRAMIKYEYARRIENRFKSFISHPAGFFFKAVYIVFNRLGV